MFKHLLVPLDGSRMAEAALPAAALLAQRLSAKVTLVHIVESAAPQQIHGERHLTNASEAQIYLTQVAQSVFPPEVQVDVHVHTLKVKDVTRGIVDHVSELNPDLIVMCTHGKGGLRGALFGSIAQQVVAQRTVPVLLIHPDSGAEFRCHKLLVPLDGTVEHEHGLPVAVELARACEAEMVLVFVVPTAGTLSGNQAATRRLLPGTTRIILDLVCLDAEEYLCNQVKRLEGEGLKVVAQVKRGDPSTIIGNMAGESHVDLIVMGTHGRAGIDAFWAGSTAPKISSRTKLPLLLVPIPESAPGR